MTTKKIKYDYSDYVSSIESYINKNFTSIDEYQKKVYESMKYSLFSGGKRIRPIISILTYITLKGEEDYSKILPFATAVELIHTYSLIHDDLPAMDDDNLRRGKPTNHKVFSEATAILAGDGLLNMAAEVLSREIETTEDVEDIKKMAKAMRYIFNASGVHGMIGGQIIDIEYEENINKDICESMYKLKTGALFKASVISSAIMAGSSDEEIAVLEEFSNCLGMAYQLRDDILDIDEDKGNTILKFKSKEEVEQDIKDLTERAIKELRSLNYDSEKLEEILLLLVDRRK